LERALPREGVEHTGKARAWRSEVSEVVIGEADVRIVHARNIGQMVERIGIHIFL